MRFILCLWFNTKKFQWPKITRTLHSIDFTTANGCFTTNSRLRITRIRLAADMLSFPEGRKLVSQSLAWRRLEQRPFASKQIRFFFWPYHPKHRLLPTNVKVFSSFYDGYYHTIYKRINDRNYITEIRYS